MPRIRRNDLPRPPYAHLLERVQSRNISADSLGLLADWLAMQPEVPEGNGSRNFPA